MLWESTYVVETKKMKSDLGRKYDQKPGDSCISQFQKQTEEPIYAYGACKRSLLVFLLSLLTDMLKVLFPYKKPLGTVLL